MDFFRQNSSFLDIRTLGVTLFHQISLYGREEYTVWPRHSDFLQRNQSGQAVTLENRPMDTEQGPWKRDFCSNMAITLGKKNLKLQQPNKQQKLEVGYPGCFMKISVYFLHFPISGSGGPKPFCIIRVCRFFTFHHVFPCPIQTSKDPERWRWPLGPGASNISAWCQGGEQMEPI